MRALYCAVSCVGIAALLLLEQMVRKSDLVAAYNKRSFRLAIWAVILVMLAEIATIFFEGAAARYRTANIIGNVFGFALSPFIPLLIGRAIGGSHKKSLLYFGLPAAVNLLLSVFSAGFPIIFWVDAENGYTRGGGFWVYIVSYTAALIFLLLQTVAAARCYQNSNRSLLSVLFGFVFLGTTVQVLVPWLHISWLCVSFALILYYVYVCDLLQQIDGLTGLLNRRTYEYNIHKMKSGDHSAIIIFDIDDFKSVNDRYGHPFGDECLTAVSSCIKKAFFRIGLCFRIGGDEFCVIARKADRPAVEKAYQNFLGEIERMRKADSRLPLVSIGYSFAAEGCENVCGAVSEADQNMYRFKRQRKGDDDPLA